MIPCEIVYNAPSVKNHRAEETTYLPKIKGKQAQWEQRHREEKQAGEEGKKWEENKNLSPETRENSEVIKKI